VADLGELVLETLELPTQALAQAVGEPS